MIGVLLADSRRVIPDFGPQAMARAVALADQVASVIATARRLEHHRHGHGDMARMVALAERVLQYAPERNPEEYLNCDVKANINTDSLPKDREELHGKLHRFMQRLAKLPARIASYFEHKCIAYAAAPELNPA